MTRRVEIGDRMIFILKLFAVLSLLRLYNIYLEFQICEKTFVDPKICANGNQFKKYN